MILFIFGFISFLLFLFLGGGCYFRVVEMCIMCGLIYFIKEKFLYREK